MPLTSPKRMIADDVGGLEVISAASQDAVLKPADMRYLAKERRFVLEVNRFHWEAAGKRGPYFRSRSLLSFDTVAGVRGRNLPPRSSDNVIQLLALRFEAEDYPSGSIQLNFAQRGVVVLDVECIDVTLYDTDKIWPALRRPDHNRNFD